MKNYGGSVVLNDPTLCAYMLVLSCRTASEEEALRNTPEGRGALLLIAKERRKVPLFIRRFPRLAGRAAREKYEEIVSKAIECGGKS